MADPATVGCIVGAGNAAAAAFVPVFLAPSRTVHLPRDGFMLLGNPFTPNRRPAQETRT